jgi:hypothetical protein
VSSIVFSTEFHDRGCPVSNTAVEISVDFLVEELGPKLSTLSCHDNYIKVKKKKN